MKRSQLKSNPAKAREWQQRSREKARDRARQTVGSRVTASTRKKVRISPAVRRRVYARSHGVCIRPDCGARCAHVHHVLDQQQFPELALVEANMVGTCARCNWTHHFAPNGRFPRSAIPACALHLAGQVGTKATSHIERYYP